MYLTLTISRTITCKLNYRIKEIIHPFRINAFIGILYKMGISFFFSQMQQFHKIQNIFFWIRYNASTAVYLNQ